jgi:hypothetical protein
MSTEYFTLNSIIYLLLSSPWNFLQNRSYLKAQQNLNKYKIEITLCIQSDHNAIKLEFNNKSSSKEYINNWRLDSTLFNNQWVIEEIKK